MADEKLKEEFDTLKGDFAKLRTDVADLLDVLKELGATRAGEARTSVEEELRARREQLREALHGAEERTRKAAKDVEDTVAEHPLSSLLAAFGVGFILAKLSQGHHDHHG